VDETGAVDSKQLSRSGRNRRTVERAKGLTLEEVTVDKRRFLLASTRVDEAAFRASVDRAVEQRHPVEKWRDWVGAPLVSIALPLSSDAKPGAFYAFLPMDTLAPFNGCLDAPFFPEPNRRDVDLSNPLNAFLLDSVAELCLELAEQIADEEDTSMQMASAAVDAISWAGDPDRLIAARERSGLDIGALRLPTVRRTSQESRWARLDVIFDWDDSEHAAIDGVWLVRACDVPMLRRGLGPKRLQALHDFVASTEFTFEPLLSNWSEWGPALAADLNRRKKVPRQRWEDFYADLAAIPDVLPHLRGKKIFRTAEGSLTDANSPERLTQRELFISPEPEKVRGRRQRLAGTALFPPASVAKRMEFADPSLNWSPAVAKAMFVAGLATEYSLSKVVAGIGRLLGNRPKKTVSLAALRWTFAAWLDHKSPELEAALKFSSLQVPVAGGGWKPANQVRFGAGWRETQGDLLADFCEAAGDVTRNVRTVREALLPPWESWPLRDRGTAAEWLSFLKLVGVRDGLATVVFKSQTHGIWTWRGLQNPVAEPLPLEKLVGPQWRQALQQRGYGFGYQSGSYSTDDTLFALPLQAEHGLLSSRAKMAYAKLVMRTVGDIQERFLTTILRRTSGNQDHVRWPSPLLAFLRESAWIPIADGDALGWARPRDCWFAPRSDWVPRFVPKTDRAVRDVLDASAAAREMFLKHLGIRSWSGKESALQRLALLGETLEGELADAEHDSLRKAYREAWQDWSTAEPRLPLPAKLVLAVQTSGRLTALRVEKGTPHPAVFIGEGADPTLENLLSSLGHHLLAVPEGIGTPAAEGLSSALGGEFLLGVAARPAILVDGEALDVSKGTERLSGSGRDWLAEVAVLALEFNVGFSNRNTERTRQLLFDALKRLRIVFARRVQVEIGGKLGELPTELDGVLPVPDEEHPAVIVESGAEVLDWPTLARISRGIAIAVDRPWLHTDMRMAFLALANAQTPSTATLDRPDDEAIARAFGQPVGRVREVFRSLRASSRRLFEFLLPVVQVRLGRAAAEDLIGREHLLTDDGDVVAALTAHGLGAAEARSLLEACLEADSLNDLRRDLGINLGALNTALEALGPPWAPLHFEAELRRSFTARVLERRPALEQLVRDAFLDAYDAGEPLTTYLSDRGLDWLSFDPAWVEDRAELDNATIDAHLDATAAARLTTSQNAGTLSGLEATRQHNRALIVETAETLRKLVLAWAAKDPANRSASTVWRGKAEQIARETLGTGVLDFRRLDRGDLAGVLARAGLWPATMPRSLELNDLGLSPEDLEHQHRAEKEAQEAELRRRRSVTIGGMEIDGGAEGAFQAMAAALDEALSSTAFRSRSGPADLREFPADEPPAKRKRGGKGGGKDPEYMSDEKRTLIGFAGEYASYRYLAKRIRNFSDEHWMSSIGRLFLALPAMQDDDGYDFRVSRTRGDLLFEVKAHEGDPGYVELERSQVAAAVAFADERKGSWSILYVAYATDPSRITVHELPNPFSRNGLNRFRPSTRQGVRLLVDRQ